MKTTLDLSNQNQAYSNYTPSDKEIEASAKLTAQLAQNRADAKARESETGCKKPFPNLFKKKKAYEKCLAESAERRNAPVDYTPPPVRIPEPKKFLGMPQDVGIVVTVLGSALILFGAYKILIAKQS